MELFVFKAIVSFKLYDLLAVAVKSTLAGVYTVVREYRDYQYSYQ